MDAFNKLKIIDYWMLINRQVQYHHHDVTEIVLNVALNTNKTDTRKTHQF